MTPLSVQSPRSLWRIVFTEFNHKRSGLPLVIATVWALGPLLTPDRPGPWWVSGIFQAAAAILYWDWGKRVWQVRAAQQLQLAQSAESGAGLPDGAPSAASSSTTGESFEVSESRGLPDHPVSRSRRRRFKWQSHETRR